MVEAVHDAVEALEGLSLEDIRQAVKVLPHTLHEHAAAINRHGSVQEAKKHGFLMEASAMLGRVDALLREALSVHQGES
ncbi:hypothetical protein NR798_24115 [Archangium gephyra]|uniref:hypothetical protein n=1 Tax=Archangium gephyra TaxID=48 RepID=UPI0035D3E0F2